MVFTSLSLSPFMKCQLEVRALRKRKASITFYKLNLQSHLNLQDISLSLSLSLHKLSSL